MHCIHLAPHRHAPHGHPNPMVATLGDPGRVVGHRLPQGVHIRHRHGHVVHHKGPVSSPSHPPLRLEKGVQLAVLVVGAPCAYQGPAPGRTLDHDRGGGQPRHHPVARGEHPALHLPAGRLLAHQQPSGLFYAPGERLVDARKHLVQRAWQHGHLRVGAGTLQHATVGLAVNAACQATHHGAAGQGPVTRHLVRCAGHVCCAIAGPHDGQRP